jgi:hypothetical protein
MSFSPLGISGLQVWYDATDPLGTGVVPSNGTSISSWADKSGNNRSATADVAATYNIDASGNYLAFSGSSHYLLPTSSFMVNNYYTIFVVERLQELNPSADSKPLIGGSGTSGGNLIITYHPNPRRMRFRHAGTNLDATTFSDFTTAASQPTRVWSFSQQVSNRQVILNGGILTSDTNNSLFSELTEAAIGREGTNYYNGHMREIIIYTGVMTPFDRQKVEGYLAWKWGLQASLDSNHPFKTSVPTASSKFELSMLPSLNLWIDASDSSKYTLSNGTISTVTDKSANARVFTGGSGFTPANTFNGTYPTFTNSSKHSILGKNTSIPITTPVTAFYVINLQPNGEQYYVLHDGAGNGRLLYYTTYSGGGIFAGGIMWSGNTQITGPLTINTGSHVISASYNGSSSVGYKNGTSYVTGTIDNINTTGLSIGGWVSIGGWIGEISEIIMFNRLLSTSDRQTVEGYLAWKWGLQSTLPASHPYTGANPTPVGSIPDAPTSLSATIGNGSITVSFTPGNSNNSSIINYKYSINGGAYTAFSPVDTSSPVTITGLTNGTSYTIRLKAVNDVGDSPASSPIIATPSTTPSAPIISVAQTGNKSATIYFTPGSNGGIAITGYKYSINNSTWSSNILTPSNQGDGSQSVTISGLSNGVESNIRLRAVNSAGDGAISSSISVTPESPFIASLPSASLPPGVNTSTVLSTIQNLSLSALTPTVVPLSNIVNIAALTGAEKSTAREAIVNLIFDENPQATKFIIPIADLVLPTIKPNITEAIVFKQDPSGSPFTPPALDSVITPNTIIYVTLSGNNDKNTFSYKSGSFSIEKIGTDSYKLTRPDGQQQTFATGDVTTLDDLTIKFSGSATLSLTNSPVVVNLDVSINANGNISVLGDTTKPTPMNVIVAQTTLPVSVLYDASSTIGGGVGYYDYSNNSIAFVKVPNSLFEFWEPSGTVIDPSSIDLSANNPLGQRQATKCLPNGSDRYRDYTKLTQHFVKSLHNVLEGSFDCSAATPYNDIKYTQPAYKTQENFGRVALSNYAHYLFGHIAATTAITNDQDFVYAMLSRDTVNRSVYKFATGKVQGALDGSTWVPGQIGSASDADLARLLVGSIVNKSDSDILKIVNQVLGQDASRAMDEDNNALAPNVRQALKFIAGDVIYMNIRLQKPNVSVGGGQQVTSGTLEGKYSAETNYTLKITLQ